MINSLPKENMLLKVTCVCLLYEKICHLPMTELSVAWKAKNTLAFLRQMLMELWSLTSMCRIVIVLIIVSSFYW